MDGPVSGDHKVSNTRQDQIRGIHHILASQSARDEERHGSKQNGALLEHFDDQKYETEACSKGLLKLVSEVR